jgi:tetratricopeptide (TPR) repeat protein
LHERFARFLEEEAGERVAEIEELVGYHLEQAYRQRIEVGLPDERAMRLAGEAAGRLAASGGRASARGDIPAAANLLQRALALLPPTAPQRTDVQVFFGATLLEQGRLVDADEHLAEAEESARATGSRASELSAQIMRLVISVQRDPAVDFDAVVAMCDAAIGELEQLHADAALAGAWRVLTMIHIFRSDTEKAGIAAASALEQARRAGYVRGEGEAMFFLTLSLLIGPTPAEDALRDCEQLLVEAPGPMSTASILITMGMLHALLGRYDEGRRLVREGREAFRELGFLVFSENMALTDAWVEFHAGDAAAAEQVLQRSAAVLESIGETSSLSIQHAVRALFVARLGRYQEALDLCERVEQGAVATVAHAHSRSARALALAGLGRIDEAVPLAREAVEIMRHTTATHDFGTTCSALADVLVAAGEDTEARLALEEARDLFERKGCVVCAAHALDRLEALGLAGRAG